MPMTLTGSCRCGAVGFDVQSHTPVPYQRCYCSICRKTAGGGGYAINLGGIAETLTVRGWDAIETYSATITRDNTCQVSSAERHACMHCASALWLYDPRWPDLIHPFASAIDSDLPAPPHLVHILLQEKPGWVPLHAGPNDACFDGYPDQSLDAWHKANGMWVP